MEILDLLVYHSEQGIVKYWDSNSIGDEGGYLGRIGVNSDGFLRHWTKGASTPELIVTEFRMVCRQMDLASACVLRPLNCLVLYFKMRGGWGERAEVRGIPDQSWRKGLQRGEELSR